MNTKEHFSEKHSFLIYISISLFVLVEVYLLPVFLVAPRSYFKLMELFMGPPLLGFSIVLSVFIIIALSIFKQGKPVLCEKPRKNFIILHFLFFIFFLFYIMYLSSLFRPEPLPEGNFLLQLIKLVKKDVERLTFRYRTLCVVLAVCCHGTLMLSQFKINKALAKYLLAFLLSTLFSFFAFSPYFFKDYIFRLWRLLAHSVGIATLYLLRALGFENSSFEFASKQMPPGPSSIEGPTISTGFFKVAIGTPCSGIEGMFTFLIALVVVLMFDWKRLDKKKVIIMGLLGIPIMYLVNIIRIFMLLLVGHFYSPELAVGLFHSYIGIILYLIAILTMLVLSYKWMLKR